MVGQIAFQLAASNILVAIFNVLPGLPLDGGRALRAGMWAVLGDRHRATVVAGWAGRGIAVATAMLVFTLYRLQVITLFGLVFILLVVLILQNTQQVKVSFLWWEGTPPLAAALLIAAAGGILVTAIAGSLRILQLRRRVKRR